MLAWFDDGDWKELSEPSKTSTMVKRNLVRGNGEYLFFAKTDSAGSKIFMIDGTGTEVEVFELKDSTIIFFGSDNESIEKNSKKQSIFVVDDKMKMRHLVSENDEEHFQQVKVFDLSHLKEVLQSYGKLDWTHAHITTRSITIKGIVYSIESEQQQEMPI